MNYTMNCACEGLRLHAAYENLMPDDLILHYGELYNYFIIYHNVIIIKIKCIISIICLNHPKSIPPPLVHGKIVLNETDPRYKKVGDQWYIVQFSHSVMSNSLWPHDCSMAGFPDHHQFPELAQTHVHQVGDDIQLSHSLASLSPPAFNLSQSESFSHQVAKVLEFQRQHQSFQWIFRTDFLQDGLVGSPCSPRDSQESLPTLQLKGINLSVLSFMVKLSHPYMTTGKTIALTRRTFLSKVMSLLFNTLSRFVTVFFSKEQVSFNFMATVTICSDFGVQENKVCHCFHCFPIYLPWSNGTWCHDLIFENVVLSQLFHSPLSLSLRGCLVSLCFLPYRWCQLHTWGY